MPGWCSAPRICRVAFSLGCAILAASPACGATLRIADYNIDCSDTASNDNINGQNPGVPTILAAIGAHQLAGHAQPIDVLALTELLDTNDNTITSSTLPAVTSALNNIYGAGTYNYVDVPDSTTGGTQFNGPSGLVYNTKTVQVIDAQSLSYFYNSVYTNPRAPMRFQLRPVGYGPNADFYVYVSHMKSGTGDSNVAARADEAAILRDDEATLPAGSSVIYTGDFNSSPPEDEFTTLTAAGEGQAFDPVNFSTSTQYLSQSTANLRFRDDYEFMTASVLNDIGPLRYVAGSFQVFGNNGTTGANGQTNAVGNTSLSDLSNASTVLADLMQPFGSDHLPAAVDYTIGVAALPEPTTLCLLLFGAVLLTACRNRHAT